MFAIKGNVDTKVMVQNNKEERKKERIFTFEYHCEKRGNGGNGKGTLRSTKLLPLDKEGKAS